MDICVVVPCYNEEESLPFFYNELKSTLQKLQISYEIIFINDGSSDATQTTLSQFSSSDSNVKVIELSRNFGHQAALLAGLNHSIGQVVITMDSDLQHPPTLIPELILKSKEGYDIVNTIREETEGVGFIKNITSRFFYKAINFLSDVSIKQGAADFRLMSRKAVDAFISFPEKVRFNRGLVSWMGFNTSYVSYNASKRIAGTTKFSFLKMLKFAINGITSFSSKPLQIPVILGFVSVVLGLIYSAFILYQFVQGETIQGWTSTVIIILFLGGAQMFSLGIVGIYVAKIFEESKNRPVYIVKEMNNFKQ
jgi:dolichol-phosphate mannosyltransferase